MPIGALIGAGAQIATAGLNNLWASRQSEEDRSRNYYYNEMAAQNADQRQRNLYADFYSPAALARQYTEAGLSPSLMFGGTPGQGGTGGAQGVGASGVKTPYMPMSMLEGAQIANIVAQTNKTKAETENIKEDTDLKILEEEWNKWRNYDRGKEFELLNTTDAEGSTMFELATNADDFNSFIESAKGNNPLLADYMRTEMGMRQLRNIYMSANRFDRDIKILSEEGVNAEFQESVLKAMNKEGFAEQNATSAIKQLKASAETSKLTVQQAGAWNDILERIGKKNETAKDVLIVLGMIFNQAQSHWKYVPVPKKNSK